MRPVYVAGEHLELKRVLAASLARLEAAIEAAQGQESRVAVLLDQVRYYQLGCPEFHHPRAFSLSWLQLQLQVQELTSTRSCEYRDTSCLLQVVALTEERDSLLKKRQAIADTSSKQDQQASKGKGHAASPSWDFADSSSAQNSLWQS